MRLKYVSVLRRLGPKRREGGYVVKGELDSQPTALWFEKFLLTWADTPIYQKVHSEPWLNNNGIFVPVKESENISSTLETVQTIISELCDTISA